MHTEYSPYKAVHHKERIEDLKKGKLIAPLAVAVPPRKVELSPILRARNAITINLLVVGISMLYNEKTINNIRNNIVNAPNTAPAIGNHAGTFSDLSI